MTNLEKIAYLQSMHKNAADMVTYCSDKIANGDDAWTVKLSLDGFKKDVEALGYALKGLQLMQNIVNEQGNEGGDYGF